jgi:dTDP-4-dehydrorhamnose reductase
MRRLALVLGAGGQLGEAMVTGLGRHYEVVARTREELDITAADAVHATVASVLPDVLINCAAYTNVDAAEQDPVRAFAVNASSVRTMARLASEFDVTLVHYSTDFVFDGSAAAPYSETDAPNPRSTYAVSKLLGEWLAADTARHYVLRVESLFGGPRAKSSVDRILDGILSGAPVRAFADRTVSPSYVEDVVAATAALLAGRSPFGVYHCVNSGYTTWSGLAREVARIAGRPDARITDISMDDAGLVAARPKFAALANAKLAAEGVVMPSWQHALERYVHARHR